MLTQKCYSLFATKSCSAKVNLICKLTFMKNKTLTTKRASGLYFFKTVCLLVCLMTAQLAFAQNITVKGTVKDSQGNPLPGVTVAVQGTKQGTITDINGHYSISAPSAKSVLSFSFIGMEPQRVTVGNQQSINVKLLDSSVALGEVVAIGYGVAKKSDVTGSLTSVTAKDIKKMPVTNALQGIQGKAAGVDITSNERPGEVGSIQIRGVRSFAASSSPYIIVDGIPLLSGGLESINPSDIESVDILKDASAAAIYGSRAANGVILVTTKKGKAGKYTLNYSGSMTVENMYDRSQMMNSSQYIDFRRWAYRRMGATITQDGYTNGGYPTVPTEAADKVIFGQDPYAWANVQKGWASGTWDGSLVPTTDWSGMVLQTGVTNDHTLSISGGTDKMRAYASVGYLNQEGTQLGQGYKRYNTAIKVDITPTSWFTMGVNINGSWSEQQYGYKASGSGAGNLYFAAAGMLPYAVPFREDGSRINYPGGDVNILNPIGEEKYSTNQRNVLRTLGSAFAEFKLMDGLKYKVSFSPDIYNRINGIYYDKRSMMRGGGEAGSTDQARLDKELDFTWTLDNLITFDRTFAKKHSVSVSLLQSSQSFHRETSSMTAENLPYEGQKWNQLGSVSTLSAFGSDLSESKMLSYMARVNYGFNNKYLITASTRWDGASVLAEGYQWGDAFPSLALGWRMEQ